MARVRLALLALSLLAAPAGAQAVSGAPSFALQPGAPAATATAQPAVGPSLSALPTAAHRAEATGPLRMMPAQRANLGEAKALMIVGAAAFVAGAIIGDTPGTIIMVGGAAVGLIGLYEYLQ